MQTSAIPTRQRQIRGFVVAWLGITLLMGALTFAGIYYATGLINDDDDGGGDDVSVAALPNTGPDEENATEPVLDLSGIETTPVPTIDKTTKEVADAALPAVEEEQPAVEDEQPAVEAAALVQTDPTATNIPTPTPLPIDNVEFQLGIQVAPVPEPDTYQIWMNEVRDKLKLSWIKQQVRWDEVEPAQGQYNWGAMDTTLPMAAEYGTKVMVSVLAAPEWAREQGADLSQVGPPADPQYFAAFLTAMLQRYPGQIHAIEVWNEMNIVREWASIRGLNAANYVTMLQVAYNTIKGIDPGIIVISGALSPTGVNDGVGAYDDFVYMDMLIQAGLLDTTDCVGAHHNGYNIGPNVPYNNVPNDPAAVFRGPFDNSHHSWSFYSTLNGYAQRIQQAGSDKKLCITEFGWAVTEDLGGTPQNFEFAIDNTLAEQAAYIDEAIQLMQDWDFVWLAFIWNLNYAAQQGWDATNNNVPYSLLRPNWTASPAYDVIAAYDFRGKGQ